VEAVAVAAQAVVGNKKFVYLSLQTNSSKYEKKITSIYLLHF